MFSQEMKKTVRGLYGMRAKPGKYGIELELEGNRLGVLCDGWMLHEEGSLRGGIEFVSSRPFRDNEVVPMVTRLAETIAANRGNIRDSFRTSTHIHYNVSNMNLEQVFGIMTVFTLFEPLFLRLCGPMRDGNLFCMSSFDTGDVVESFHRSFQDIHARYPQVHNRGKYATLNTGRLHDLGTLEFRCFPQSINPEQIKTWCEWIDNLHVLTEREADKTFRQLVKRAQRNPVTVAREVFGVYNLPDDVEELIRFGARTTYELTRLWQHYSKLEDKKEKGAEPKKTKGLTQVAEGVRFARWVDVVNPHPQELQD